MQMHRSCHEYTSQLSRKCIAAVMQMHRGCHANASQLSCKFAAAVAHESCAHRGPGENGAEHCLLDLSARKKAEAGFLIQQ